MENDLVYRWKESGLLDELSNGQQAELAAVLEEMAQYCISLKKELGAFSIIFPLIRKLYTAINKLGKFSLIVNCVDLLWDVEDRYKKLGIKNMKFSTIDVEAEFIQLYCERYVEDLKKRGII